MQNKQISTGYKGTGKYWYFNNGQWAEKTEIKEETIYQLQIINNKITGLYRWVNNDCGGQRLNSACFSIHNLTGTNLEMFNRLID